jgi:hypothetical protein
MGFKKAMIGMAVAAFTFAASLPAIAQMDPSRTAAYDSPPPATQLDQASYLGYIRSSSSLIDDESRAGLQALSDTLADRTSVVPGGVVALDPDQDDLSLYPFIYWPVQPDAQALSDKAQQKVQKYLDSGGVILFDVQDKDPVSGQSPSLQRLLQGIEIKPLTALAQGDILTKTFYLLAHYKGLEVPLPEIWVENPGMLTGENISNVVVGDSNWAGAWAAITLAQDSQEREEALRFGVNVVMEALTRHYKDDAVHTPAILEKMHR